MKQQKILLVIFLVFHSACSVGILENPTSVPSNTPSPTRTLFIQTATERHTSTFSPTPASVGDDGIQGWALLADKNDYSDVEMTDLPLDYINLKRIRQVLLDAGWQEDQILEVLEFNQEDLQQGLSWLAEHAEEDDLVFVYISSHGLYLYQNVHWGDFILMDWIKIKSSQRVLILESCRAGAFTSDLQYDPKPYLSVGAVGKDEDGWAGLEEEGLPIIGSVFTYYFTDAFSHPEADNDDDGLVSVQEAAHYADEHQRTYMHQVVFKVAEFKEMYEESGFDTSDPEFPHVIIEDRIGSPVILSSISQ